MCQEAQALQENKDETNLFTAEDFQADVNVAARKLLASGSCSHLGSQLLLTIHQALNVSRVIAAALTGCDGTFKGGAGDLWGDGGGGGQGARAHAGGQRLAQGFGGGSRIHWSGIAQLLPQQEQVTGLLHLEE